MASTYSNLKIELMETGQNAGTWGNVTNINLGTAIEQALVESATIDLSGGDVTLTLTDTNAAQNARALRFNCTGATADQNIIVPAIQKPYIVNNGGSYNVTVKVSGQTGVTVPAGRSYLLYNNGTDVINPLVSISPVAGGTGQNTLTANSVVIGNGTGPVTFVAPGTSGNVLASDGTNWVSGIRSPFDSGTVAIFGQTSAPTGWTKNTSTGDESTLRIVTGSVSTGGSVDFTTAFASQTPSGTVSVSSITATVGDTTLSTPQIPSHSHPNVMATLRYDKPGGAFHRNANSGSTGGGGSHTHPFSFTSATATFAGDAINLAVKYVDVIRATKD